MAIHLNNVDKALKTSLKKLRENFLDEGLGMKEVHLIAHLTTELVLEDQEKMASAWVILEEDFQAKTLRVSFSNPHYNRVTL